MSIKYSLWPFALQSSVTLELCQSICCWTCNNKCCTSIPRGRNRMSQGQTSLGSQMKHILNSRPRLHLGLAVGCQSPVPQSIFYKHPCGKHSIVLWESEGLYCNWSVPTFQWLLLLMVESSLASMASSLCWAPKAKLSWKWMAVTGTCTNFDPFFPH